MGRLFKKQHWPWISYVWHSNERVLESCNEIMGVVVLELVVFGFFCRWPLKSGCLDLYAIASQTLVCNCFSNKPFS